MLLTILLTEKQEKLFVETDDNFVLIKITRNHNKLLLFFLRGFNLISIHKIS